MRGVCVAERLSSLVKINIRLGDSQCAADGLNGKEMLDIEWDNPASVVFRHLLFPFGIIYLMGRVSLTVAH